MTYTSKISKIVRNNRRKISVNVGPLQMKEQANLEFDSNVFKYAGDYDVTRLGLPSKIVKALLRETERP